MCVHQGLGILGGILEFCLPQKIWVKEQSLCENISS